MDEYSSRTKENDLIINSAYLLFSLDEKNVWDPYYTFSDILQVLIDSYNFWYLVASDSDYG